MSTLGKNRSRTFRTASALLGMAILLAALSTGCGTQGTRQGTTSDSKISEVSASNFEEQVLKSKVPVLVDFYADWCEPCQRQSPILEELAGEIESVRIVKVDFDQNTQLAKRYNVEAIPTLLVFQNGEVVNRHLGLASKQQVKSLLAR